MTFATDEPGESRREGEATPASTDQADRKPRWYAVQVASGCEKRVKADLERRAQTFDVSERIFQVEIPQSKAFKIRKGISWLRVSQNGNGR